jgi:hypothetical protein
MRWAAPFCAIFAVGDFVFFALNGSPALLASGVWCTAMTALSAWQGAKWRRRYR